MLKIPALEKLIHELSRLPGVGPRTAQRLAYFILKSPSDYSLQLTQALQRVREEIHTCPECFNFTDQPLCSYCKDPLRTQDLLCVVEEPSDISKIEASGMIKGRYHVLQGAISPLDGIGPQKLRIQELIIRLEGLTGTLPSSQKLEVLMALNSTLEGDTTVLYILQQIRGLLPPSQQDKLRISRMAHGIPIGGNIEYVDDRTIVKAIENRIPL